MSGDSSEEKTEKPSAKKLNDAHKKGQVAKSTELSTGLSLLATLLVVMSLVPWFALKIAALFLAVERSFSSLDAYAVKSLIFESLILVGSASLIPLAVAAIVFTVSMWLQTGTVFSLDTVTPKLERLNPMEGLKKLVSMKSLVQFALMLLKSGIIGTAVALVCLSKVAVLEREPHVHDRSETRKQRPARRRSTQSRTKKSGARTH
jgi:flagellar biosynthesis protein FlhB